MPEKELTQMDDGEEKNVPEIPLSKLYKLIREDAEAKEEVKKQLGATDIQAGLQRHELKTLRVKDLARDAYLGDISDSITGFWRFRMAASKLVRTHVLILSDTFGGIIHAPRKETAMDWRWIFIVAIAMFVFVSFFWGSAISYWLQVNLASTTIQIEVAMIVIAIVVILFIILRRRRRRT